ncbi:MAG: MoxR family ATPase, partial [Meiothermus ruber]|nr:MoxR family ATPase [Meiothermus ruber]
MNPAEQNPLLQSVEGIQAVLRERNYIADLPMATALRLVMALRKPLLVEGPAGVGKTQVAKTLAEVLHTRLIRLQCYEGLDTAQALYEWNYPKQMLH